MLSLGENEIKFFLSVYESKESKNIIRYSSPTAVNKVSKFITSIKC